MPSILSDDDKETVKRFVPKQTNKIQAVAVARLYVAYPNPAKWTYTGIQGAIVLSNDLVGNTYWLKMVDISSANRGVIWDQEIFESWSYNQDRTYFHSFEIEECLAGLSFMDEKEAKQFKKKMDDREKNASRGTRATPFGGAAQSHPHKHGLLGGLFGSRHASAPTPPDSPRAHGRMPSLGGPNGHKSSEFAVLDAFDSNWRENFGQDLRDKGLTDEFIKENQEFIVDFLKEEQEKLMAGARSHVPPPPPPPPTGSHSNGIEPRNRLPPPPPPPADGPRVPPPPPAPRRGNAPAPPPARRSGKTEPPAGHREPTPPSEPSAPEPPKNRFAVPPPLPDAGKLAHALGGSVRSASRVSRLTTAANSKPRSGPAASPSESRCWPAAGPPPESPGERGPSPTTTFFTAGPTCTSSRRSSTPTAFASIAGSSAAAVTLVERASSAPSTYLTTAFANIQRATSAAVALVERSPTTSFAIKQRSPGTASTSSRGRCASPSSPTAASCLGWTPGSSHAEPGLWKAGGIKALKKVDRSQIRDRSGASVGGSNDTGPHGSGLPPAGVAPGGGGDMANALAAALQKRKEKVSRSDDESDNDDW
ncbi:Proline-rich protein LAS17 [Colletotrichum fructicola Nara gc5]|uniref:Proline-rich protein LAS17 n=1 Tax=Colletotrichum fructicola (strain Nara gc5) TaxID=1213859 RepID=A0A7J6IVC6_COLFN|nr:Proline-rich protein LAS17 [Colletotrichum fructicola]KAF4480739.1 Proline-rich protein LAS17 [Colletotrichum fructicola Nara gc5]KAF5488595.1 Proline-rich protein LAS17 [Colletotrichum fructicola]